MMIDQKPWRDMRSPLTLTNNACSSGSAIICGRMYSTEAFKALAAAALFLAAAVECFAVPPLVRLIL